MEDDKIKEEILRYLYERWRTPKSIDGSKAKVSEIQKSMKSCGINREETNRNLSYLVDNGWVKEDVKQSQFRKGKFSYPTESRTFRISTSGIELFHGKSKFQKLEGITGINIQNVSGVVNIGDGNYIRNEFVSIFRSLDELDGKIRITDQLNDADKLSYRAEVKTIQSQLSKPNPDKGIISKSWSVLEKLATISSIADLIIKVKPVIMKLIGF
ncbi:MAG: hypothetical protein NTY73_03450 [Candidatus Micrarchaeota archaeon]|nr:hypothetical protein [Candidatus Micrarchaeota archaeon]